MPVRGKRLLAAEIVVLVGTLVAAVASSEVADWEPAGLVLVLLGLAVVSDLLALQHKTQRISGAFFAIVLALALCGPAPAVLIGAVCVLVDAVRTRPALHKLLERHRLYDYPAARRARLPGAREGDVDRDRELTFAIAVFGAFVLCNVLNFALIAVAMSVYTRHSARPGDPAPCYVPVVPSELASGLLAASVAVLYRETGIAALALLALVVLVFQFLLRELLRSQRRAEELAALQLGVLASMVDTLAMRDRMTARHSAAVARYARALAEAHGCSRDEQDLVHTAGLLHDVGKFSFPDAILLAPAPLTEEDWKIVRRHPEEGARVVARIEPYARGGHHPLPSRALGRQGLPAQARRRDRSRCCRGWSRSPTPTT